eukprot:Gb_23675 [translate_table: standard]
MDSLSLLLSLANVGAHSEVLVLDMLGGLVTGAVAERLGGKGFVCNTHENLKPPPMDIVGIFNFDELTSSRILRAPLSELLSAHEKCMERIASKIESNSGIITSFLSDDISSSGSKSNSEESVHQDGTLIENAKESPTILQRRLNECTTQEEIQLQQPDCNIEVTRTSEMELHPDMVGKVDGKEEIGCQKAHKIVRAGRQATSEDILLWTKNGFTSLIVGAPELDPWTVVAQLLPLLSFSAPFAVYHQYLQPLAECMHKLQAGHMAVSLQISEPWLREYQVLPSRTHPHMQMSSSGGYILSGIRIYNSEI